MTCQPGRGRELATGGDFEPPEFGDTGTPDGQLQVRFDFSAWDRAMAEAIDIRHVNTFRLHVEGLGGGTYAEQARPGCAASPRAAASTTRCWAPTCPGWSPTCANAAGSMRPLCTGLTSPIPTSTRSSSASRS
ncbi:MAG: hypothetical protein U1G05_01070 [Kiritimatiellia bacterium]